MPKVITDNEKQRLKDLLFEKVVDLIREKGIAKITVEDITNAVGIGKGSFYLYYKSKEELIYEVLKRCEKSSFSRMMTVNGEKNKREKIKKGLYEVYLAKDSIVLYVSPADLRNLFRKLPDDIYEKETAKSNNYFQQTLELLDIDPQACDINVLSQLMDTLHFIASNNNYAEGQQKTLEIMVNSIADYLSGENVQ